MPLSEFYQASIEGKIDSGLSKMPSRSSNPSSFMADNEFVELLWENGPAVMQRRFNRPRKTSIATANFSSSGDRVEGKDSTAVNMRKIGRLEGIDAFASDLSPSDSSRNVRLSTQFDSMVPWINYPIEDSYCSDLFPEFSGLKDQPNVEQGITSKALADGLDSSRAGTSQMHRLSLFPNFMSRMEDLGAGGASNARQEGKSDDLLDIRLLKQDLAASKPDRVVGSMNSMNFSHFARPGMLGKATVQTANQLRSNENSATATGSNCIESTIIHSSSGSQSTSSIVELVTSAKTPRVERLEAVREEDMPRKNLDDDISRSNLRMFGAEKDHEAIIASSSVSSGNNAGATSDDPKQSAKRKNQEGEEESDNHLEDPEDASVGIKMPNAAKGRNAKRSRTAEVHNLSERRRRDRINEKMRALQDLIPNCTKVDKASMLDEAIEYLKSLQLQVQMMSMGSGFCMPPINPMMLPSGMQPLHVPPIAHFSHMGMHMRFNYGMGMLDMNGSPGSPLIAAHPFNPIRGPYGIPQPTNLPMFAQGLPISVPPHAPQLKSFLGVPTNAKSMPGTSKRTATSSQAPDASSAKDRSKDHKEKNLNLELMQKASSDDSQGTNESSQQCTSNQTSSTSETAN